MNHPPPSAHSRRRVPQFSGGVERRADRPSRRGVGDARRIPASLGGTARERSLAARRQRDSTFGIARTGRRVSATPNQTVHRLIRIEDASQRRLPSPISNHIPSAQPAKEATPATMAVQADQAGVARSALRASFPAITATASAKNAKPLALPSA